MDKIIEERTPPVFRIYSKLAYIVKKLANEWAKHECALRYNQIP